VKEASGERRKILLKTFGSRILLTRTGTEVWPLAHPLGTLSGASLEVVPAHPRSNRVALSLLKGKARSKVVGAQEAARSMPNSSRSA
jgi:hypothetical protein